MKHSASFQIKDSKTFRNKMLNWANRFNIFCLLDNRLYRFGEPPFDCLLAAGCSNHVSAGAGDAFNKLRSFWKLHENEWLFGHLGYDLKNETESLVSEKPDGIGFPDLHFFVPSILLQLKGQHVYIETGSDPVQVFSEIESMPGSIFDINHSPVDIKSRFHVNDYKDVVEKIRQHILRGDCYEINFCQEFYAEGVVLDPVTTYARLSELSPNPFSALYKLDDRYCLCASPERYLKKTGARVISQPIKGTAKRNPDNELEDQAAKEHLLTSEKERSENVMVVDLVRNDLSRICREGSVHVDELFGIYSFPQVHQMISTVSGELMEGINWVDAVEATFPMGSMTGAPKKSVMQLAERYERTRRGLYSGAIGYVQPGGDFDFNVVIRSMLYNAAAKYLSFQVGSAITFNSNAEKEYEECLLKAEAMMRVLKSS